VLGLLEVLLRLLLVEEVLLGLLLQPAPMAG
jgi:hypothetical protein